MPAATNVTYLLETSTTFPRRQLQTRPLKAMPVYSVIWHLRLRDSFLSSSFVAQLLERSLPMIEVMVLNSAHPNIFSGNDAFNRLNSIIFVINRSISVEIDTSLAFFQKMYFWRPFWIFFENAVRHIGAIFQPISQILNSKRQLSTYSPTLKKIGVKLRP